MCKLALIQMYVEPGQLDKNLANATQHIEIAATNGAQIILLPEVMDLGWLHPAAKTLAHPIYDSKTINTLSGAAIKHNVYICSGFSERAGQSIYNAAVIINPNGQIIAHSRKLNELLIAHDLYEQGDRLEVAQTPLGNLGLMICADGFANDHTISQTLAYMGADIILSPCAWAVPEDWDNEDTPYGDTWRNCYAPVAKQYHLWIAAASNVGWITAGEWEGRPCIGCSTVFNPNGEEILQGPFGPDAETILYVDIELQPRPERGIGWDPKFRK